MSGIIFKNIGRDPGTYSNVHGIIQNNDGSLFVVGYIPPGESSDTFYDNLRNCETSDMLHYKPILDLLNTLKPKFRVLTRMRRVVRGGEVEN